MRINMMANEILFYFATLMAAVMLSSQAPQAVLVDQDVAAPEEYPDGAGRGGDEWWRNYEVVEDRANELGDHLEMLYMYSVNPLELTTVRSTRRRSTTTPAPQAQVTPVSRPQHVATRRPTTAAPPPTELPFRPASNFRVQSPVVPQRSSQQFPLTQAPFQDHAPRRSSHRRHPSTVPAPQVQPTYTTFHNPAVSESQLLPRRHPSTVLTSTEDPVTSAAHTLVQEQRFPESFQEQLPVEQRQTYVQQPVDVQAALHQEGSNFPLNTPAEAPVFPQNAPAEVPVFPLNTPSKVPIFRQNTPAEATVFPQNTRTEAPVFPQNTRAEAPAFPQNTRAEAPVFPQNTRAEAPVFPLNAPEEAPVGLPQKPVFFVPSLPLAAHTQPAVTPAEALPETPSSDPAFTFSSDRQFTQVPLTSENDRFQPQQKPSPGIPGSSTSAFRSQRPVTPAEPSPTSGATRNPFLVPAAIPVVQQRYSRLLNRYSLLDQVDASEVDASLREAPQGSTGSEGLESNRLVRQPAPVGHAPFAPSSRNFLNHTSEETAATSKRPRRRRLKTTTAPPVAETDTQLSDSEEVLFTQPQPRRRLKTTQGRFVPSTATSAPVYESSSSPGSQPEGFQAEPLSIQSPAARPITSESRRRTKRPQLDAVVEDSSTLAPPASPLVSSTRDVVPTGRNRGRGTRPQTFLTSTTESAITESQEPHLSTSTPFSTFKSSRLQKTRPSFSPRATSLASTSQPINKTQESTLAPELSTERSSARRARFGATQGSRRTTPGAVSTSEVPVEVSTLPAPVTQQQFGRSRRLNPRNSGQRFTTSPPSTTTVESSAPAADVTTSLPPAAPFQSQSASKFKPRGSSFRRTTTTTTEPSTTTAIPSTTTTATDTTSATELTKPPETGKSSRFKPRPSKFRAFPTGTTTTTATTVAATEASTDSASTTELQETTTTSEKSRKFQGRNTFPRFQDSAKRAPLTSATTTEAASETPTTTRTTSSKFFKSRAPFSRFQPGTTRAPAVEITEVPLTSSTAEVLLPVVDQQQVTSPRTSQRPLFKSRTSGQFSFRSTPPAATSAAPPSLPPIAETSPASVPPVVPVHTFQPVAVTPLEPDSPTPFSGKRRRRPITKKSFSPAGSDVTAPTFTVPEALPSLGQSQEESFQAHSTAALHSPLPVANEQYAPLKFQAAPPSTEEVPKRRKVRRRKLTKKRSTQSFSDEQDAAGDIAKVSTILTSTATENVPTAITTSATSPSTSASSTTTLSIAAQSATTTTKIASTTTTTATSTLDPTLKESFSAKERPLESKSGLSGKNAKKQLLLESLEEPLTAEADESGDDSGIWFSDSAGIGSEPEGTRGVEVGGGLSKLFHVEHEDVAIRNPPPAQIRGNSDSDDSKLWFGLADDGSERADSSPEKATVEKNDTDHHQSRSLSESKPEPEEHVAQEEQSSSLSIQEAAADSSGENKENKTATFSVSSSTSVHTEVSKSRSSQTASEATDANEEDLKLQDGPPPIIIIDKVNHEEEQAESGDVGPETTERETTTSTTSTATTTTEATTEAAPPETEAPKTERSGRGRSASSTTSRSRDKSSRTSSRDAAARNRANAARSEANGKSRSGASSRRNRTSTTTLATTTEEVVVTEDVTLEEATEAPKKKPSDEVNYFGEDEVVPSSHGALDGPLEGELESGPPEETDFQAEAEGEVASVDVSEHNDPNDHGHGSETAGDDDARWELSPLRESSSFNVEVRSKAPKQLQLASRREAKSSRSDLGDEFSSKRESRNKMRNFLKILGMSAAAFASEDAFFDSGNGTKRVRVIPLKSFAFPMPPMKTPEDIAELLETITSVPSGVSRPFQQPASVARVALNTTASNASVSGKPVQPLAASAYKTQTLNGPTNCSRTDRNICPMSEEYPRNLVELVVKQHEETAKRLWRELEAKRTPAELFPEDSQRKGEALSVCDSSIEILQPGWARDATTGKWMIVINTPEYPQFLRVESCLRLKRECLFISPYYKSSCEEHYSAHRMVAIRPSDPASGPFVAIFKFPCGCSCKVGMLHSGN